MVHADLLGPEAGSCLPVSAVPFPGALNFPTHAVPHFNTAIGSCKNRVVTQMRPTNVPLLVFRCNLCLSGQALLAASAPCLVGLGTPCAGTASLLLIEEFCQVFHHRTA